MGVRKSFEGVQTSIPGVYSKSEYPSQLGAAGVAANIVAIIGSSRGGIPYNASGYDDEDKVNWLTSVAEAMNVLVSGNGYYATEFYLSPTRDPSLSAPAKCMYIRIDPAEQAEENLKDGLTNIISLKSSRFGALANQLCRKCEAGTTSGHKVTIKFQGATIAEKDDISMEYMSIQYTGAGTAAEMDIDATTLATTVTGAAADNLSITLSQYPTLGQLIAYIDAHPKYTCSLKGRSDANTATFDVVVNEDIKTSPYIAKANVEALIQFFNNESGGEIIASLATGATRVDVDNDTDYVFFSGGTDGTPTNSDWAGACTLLEKFDVNHIVVASGDSSIHAIVDSHCQQMSSILNKKNRTWSGGASSSTTTKSARIAEAKALNSARAEYCITPFYRYDAVNGGVKQLFAPFLGAALIAGIKYGNFITISATFKALNILGVSEEYNRLDKDDYIYAGCTVFGKAPMGGFEVIHNVTTYQGSNTILNLPSALRTADFITLDSQVKIRERIASLNRAPNAVVITAIQNYIITNLLPGYERAGFITQDPNTGDPAFSDVEFKVIGDTFELSFTAILVVPLHFVFIKQKFIVSGQNL